jgi:hypothetical protein
MNIENILNNDEYKIFFLKAIILGINYGKSDNVNYYKENIEKEIEKINLKNKEINITPKYEVNTLPNTSANTLANTSAKYENNIINLENQKTHTLSMIQQLSMNNYSYNYSRINILKNNLLLINQEIEKNRYILKQKNNETKKNITTLKNNFVKPTIIQNNTISNVKNISSINHINPIKNKIEKEENLVGELEKTLGNLSKLLVGK